MPKRKPSAGRRLRGKPMLSPPEIIGRLSVLYGEPSWRPHGDPVTELVLTILSQNTTNANSDARFKRLRRRYRVPAERGAGPAATKPERKKENASLR